MNGIFRLFLALLVVFGHLAGTKYAIHFGSYAVRLFFILSGLAMTAALNKVYAFDFRRFALNRALRLLPLYYLVCLATWIAIEAFPGDAVHFMGRWTQDRDFLAILANLLVLPLDRAEPFFRFAEQSWSLSVELMMYALLWLAIARGSSLALAGFVAGTAYHVAAMVYDLPFSYRYFEPTSAIMAFSLGATLYFVLHRGPRLFTPRVALAMLPFWLANLLAAGSILPTFYVEGVGYYASTALGALIVGGLSRLEPGGRLARFDHWCGDLAYPVFLVHWLAGFVTHLAFGTEQTRGWIFALASLPVLFLMASALSFVNSWLIEPLRGRIRGATPARPSPETPEKATAAATA